MSKDFNEEMIEQLRGVPRTEPQDIEPKSFKIIDDILKPEDPDDPVYRIKQRMVHAAGDPDIYGEIVVSSGVVEAAAKAFAATKSVFCDVQMVRSGVEGTAKAAGIWAKATEASPQVEMLAKKDGITRTAAGFRLYRRDLAACVVAVGNAPTALFELLRLAYQEEIRPAVIIGTPVGFVGAKETKEVLEHSDIPFVSVRGYRGGSAVAVAATNALIRIYVEGSSQISRLMPPPQMGEAEEDEATF